MSGITRLKWVRIVAGAIAAEALPILVLVAIVFVYGFVRKPDALSPEEFAPLAGAWVGPIGGFLATGWFARWAARRAPQNPIAHGVVVGVVTALLDIGIAAGAGAISPLILVSNCGRLAAGLLGGWLGRASSPNQ
jgi:hypothetical protein